LREALHRRLRSLGDVRGVCCGDGLSQLSVARFQRRHRHVEQLQRRFSALRALGEDSCLGLKDLRFHVSLFEGEEKGEKERERERSQPGRIEERWMRTAMMWNWRT